MISLNGKLFPFHVNSGRIVTLLREDISIQCLVAVAVGYF